MLFIKFKGTCLLAKKNETGNDLVKMNLEIPEKKFSLILK